MILQYPVILLSKLFAGCRILSSASPDIQYSGSPFTHGFSWNPIESRPNRARTPDIQYSDILCILWYSVILLTEYLQEATEYHPADPVIFSIPIFIYTWIQLGFNRIAPESRPNPWYSVFWYSAYSVIFCYSVNGKSAGGSRISPA